MSSWLYERRHQLDGLKPLLEIAHWFVISHVPPEDQDDVEQEILIALWLRGLKCGSKGKPYLWTVARYQLYAYLRRRYKEKRLWHIDVNDEGEILGETQVFLHDGDIDTRLDAITTLATIPERLIQIGHKLLNGEKLSEAETHYRINQKAKLNCRRYAQRLFNWEKRRILRLHRKGMSVNKIARTMERSNRAVMRVLADSQPLSRQGWLAKMETAAKERDERIRHAHFVDRKGIKEIEREFHHGWLTVREAIRAEPAQQATPERELAGVP